MRRNITKKVILQFIPLIIGALLVSSIVANIAIKVFLEKKVMEDLTNEAAIIRNVITTEIGNEKNIDREKFKDVIMRSHKLDKVGLDSRLEVITKTANNVVMSQSKDSQFDSQMLTELTNRIQKGKESFIIKNDKDDFKYYITVLPINKLVNNNRKVRYWVILYTTTKEVSNLTNTILRINILIMIIIGFISIVIGVFFARSLTKPIIKLKNRANRISKRDFDSIEMINTGDEIEELSESLEHMVNELKNYDESQKRFLQNASHELKTPLTSISGYAEGLKDGVFDNTEEALDTIIDESLRLKKLVEQIIFLSKLETTHEFFEMKVVDLKELIGDAVKKVYGLSAKKSVNVKLDIEDKINIYADEDKLIQGFINILSNCIRHAESNIDIAVRQEQELCHIIISDDGEGFSKEDLEHLFDRFYKGANGSTGLGMTITKSIINKHGGQIRVSNNENGGAKFIVTFKTI